MDSEQNETLKFAKKYGLELSEKAEKLLKLMTDPSYKMIEDFQSFLDMRKRYGDPWTRDSKWPIKVTCGNCNMDLELSPVDLNGAFVFMFPFMQYNPERPMLTAVMECPGCDEPFKL